MRFACLNTVAPGTSFAEQCAAIAQAGCEGVETIVFPSTDLDAWLCEVRATTMDMGLEVVAVIVGGLALHREGHMQYVRAAMQATCELGASSLLTPEYAAQNPLPLFPPFPAPGADERARVMAAMGEIGALVTSLKGRVLIEPITPFESRFCRSVADALALCTASHSPLVQIALDTHNMNLTEVNVAASIRAASMRIGHVHLADNNRMLPGHGHIDFDEVMTALSEVNYNGWLSFECAVPGDFVSEVRQAIARIETRRAERPPGRVSSTRESASLPSHGTI